MDNEYRIEIIEKELQELIKSKWITVSEKLMLHAVARHIAAGLSVAERELRKENERHELYELLDKHFPGKLEKVLKVISEK